MEYYTSITVTKSLVYLITRQEQDLQNYDVNRVSAEVNRMNQEKEEKLKEDHRIILELVSDDLKRYIELATEKGAGSWLTALPMQSFGYDLNKQEFRDGICLRYGWRIPNTPTHCTCDKKNTVDHILNCKLGGFVISRHDVIRDMEAEFLREVCKDVKIEPALLPVGNVVLHGNTADNARLDTSAVGLFSPMERNFTDVRVFNANSKSHRDKSLPKLYQQQEREKKFNYNQRVIQVEKGTFTPLVFNTSGGMGPEATRFHKRLAERIAAKKKESYADVMKHIRTRLRFAILRGTLIAIRGDRGRRRREQSAISDLSYNLIPEPYEVV